MWLFRAPSSTHCSSFGGHRVRLAFPYLLRMYQLYDLVTSRLGQFLCKSHQDHQQADPLRTQKMRNGPWGVWNKDLHRDSLASCIGCVPLLRVPPSSLGSPRSPSLAPLPRALQGWLCPTIGFFALSARSLPHLVKTRFSG